MREYFVTYSAYRNGNTQISHMCVVLDETEKANRETFEKKIENEGWNHDIFAWSLIEK